MWVGGNSYSSLITHSRVLTVHSSRSSWSTLGSSGGSWMRADGYWRGWNVSREVSGPLLTLGLSRGQCQLQVSIAVELLGSAVLGYVEETKLLSQFRLQLIWNVPALVKYIGLLFVGDF